MNMLSNYFLFAFAETATRAAGKRIPTLSVPLMWLLHCDPGGHPVHPADRSCD